MGIFPIGITCSNFQLLGHSPELKMFCKIFLTGDASSGENSWRITFGKSLSVPDFGFFADLILQKVSYSDICGGWISLDRILSFTLDGNKSTRLMAKSVQLGKIYG